MRGVKGAGREGERKKGRGGAYLDSFDRIEPGGAVTLTHVLSLHPMKDQGKPLSREPLPGGEEVGDSRVCLHAQLSMVEHVRVEFEEGFMRAVVVHQLRNLHGISLQLITQILPIKIYRQIDK